ncbi:MAG: hypothetical protein HOV71_25525 [Hamadaea sp.]|uniref:hypothetical protein n=1 Tax=Hamadaea sp. NPDC050747 TaxID=3155789 RepID=UPI0017D9154E|nr:hypothetical protein [Hamadaea sp.]NUR51500.1 hypothetical protein [Hamadaea sp.]NUT05932.1 hypothetical protein [Hamadaea sp.]
MNQETTIAAWKGVSDQDGPANPAGELAEALTVAGGVINVISTEHVHTLGCCPGFTNEPGCWTW